MDSERHRDQMFLLIESLKTSWTERKDFYVGGNMFLYFSATQARNQDFRGPDVFVVLGVPPHERRSWVVWEEDGHAPDVVIELLSESTESVDRGRTKKVYAEQMRVPRYYLFDPETAVLEGYALDLSSREYRRLASLPSGDVPCEPLGLSLGVRTGTYLGNPASWLRWIGRDGDVLASREEVARAAEQKAEAAEKRAEEAQKRAEGADQEAARLAARLAEYERRFGALG